MVLLQSLGLRVECAQFLFFYYFNYLLIILFYFQI